MLLKLLRFNLLVLQNSGYWKFKVGTPTSSPGRQTDRKKQGNTYTLGNTAAN